MSNAATAAPAERLRLYRTTHRIQMIPLEDTVRGYEAYCSVDGIRIIPVKGGRWRHHPDDIERLLKGAYVSEIDGDGLSEAKRAREIVIEDEESYVVTVDEDDEWTNREGMPEFNGSFR